MPHMLEQRLLQSRALAVFLAICLAVQVCFAPCTALASEPAAELSEATAVSAEENDTASDWDAGASQEASASSAEKAPSVAKTATTPEGEPAFDVSKAWSEGGVTLSEPGEYKLSSDVEADTTLVIAAPEGATITLDFNGHSAKVAGDVVAGIDVSSSRGTVEVYDSAYTKGDVPVRLTVQGEGAEGAVAGVLYRMEEGAPTACLAIRDIGICASVATLSDDSEGVHDAYAVWAGYPAEDVSQSVDVALENCALTASVKAASAGTSAAPDGERLLVSEDCGMSAGVYANARGVSLNGKLNVSLASDGEECALYSTVAGAFAIGDRFSTEPGAELSIFAAGNETGSVAIAVGGGVQAGTEGLFVDATGKGLVLKASEEGFVWDDPTDEGAATGTEGDEAEPEAGDPVDAAGNAASSQGPALLVSQSPLFAQSILIAQAGEPVELTEALKATEGSNKLEAGTYYLGSDYVRAADGSAGSAMQRSIELGDGATLELRGHTLEFWGSSQLVVSGSSVIVDGASNAGGKASAITKFLTSYTDNGAETYPDAAAQLVLVNPSDNAPEGSVEFRAVQMSYELKSYKGLQENGTTAQTFRLADDSGRLSCVRFQGNAQNKNQLAISLEGCSLTVKGGGYVGDRPMSAPEKVNALTISGPEEAATITLSGCDLFAEGGTFSGLSGLTVSGLSCDAGAIGAVSVVGGSSTAAIADAPARFSNLATNLQTCAIRSTSAVEVDGTALAASRGVYGNHEWLTPDASAYGLFLQAGGSLGGRLSYSGDGMAIYGTSNAKSLVLERGFAPEGTLSFQSPVKEDYYPFTFGEGYAVPGSSVPVEYSGSPSAFVLEQDEVGLKWAVDANAGAYLVILSDGTTQVKTSLSDAVTAAKEDKEPIIRLLRDAEEAKNGTFAASKTPKNLTLDLNGHTLKSSTGKHTLSYTFPNEKNCKLVITSTATGDDGAVLRGCLDGFGITVKGTANKGSGALELRSVNVSGPSASSGPLTIGVETNAVISESNISSTVGAKACVDSTGSGNRVEIGPNVNISNNALDNANQRHNGFGVQVTLGTLAIAGEIGSNGKPNVVIEGSRYGINAIGSTKGETGVSVANAVVRAGNDTQVLDASAIMASGNAGVSVSISDCVLSAASNTGHASIIGSGTTTATTSSGVGNGSGVDAKFTIGGNVSYDVSTSDEGKYATFANFAPKAKPLVLAEGFSPTGDQAFSIAGSLVENGTVFAESESSIKDFSAKFTCVGAGAYSLHAAAYSVGGVTDETKLVWSQEDQRDVAQIVRGGETTGYPSVKLAIAATQAGDTVKLLDDDASASQLVVSKPLTLDLNGHTLTVNVDKYLSTSGGQTNLGAALCYTGSGELAVTSSASDKGSIVANMANANSGSAVKAGIGAYTRLKPAVEGTDSEEEPGSSVRLQNVDLKVNLIARQATASSDDLYGIYSVTEGTVVIDSESSVSVGSDSSGSTADTPLVLSPANAYGVFASQYSGGVAVTGSSVNVYTSAAPVETVLFGTDRSNTGWTAWPNAVWKVDMGDLSADLLRELSDRFEKYAKYDTDSGDDRIWGTKRYMARIVIDDVNYWAFSEPAEEGTTPVIADLYTADGSYYSDVRTAAAVFVESGASCNVALDGAVLSATSINGEAVGVEAQGVKGSVSATGCTITANGSGEKLVLAGDEMPYWVTKASNRHLPYLLREGKAQTSGIRLGATGTSLSVGGSTAISASDGDGASIVAPEFTVTQGFSTSQPISVLDPSGENTAGDEFAKPADGVTIPTGSFQDAKGDLSANKDDDGSLSWGSITITFMNGDRVISRAEGLKAGDTAPLPDKASLAKESSEQYDYELRGFSTYATATEADVTWAEDATQGDPRATALIAEGDATYYVVYKQTLRKYQVKFVDAEGNAIEGASGEVEYGKSPVEALNPQAPSRDGYVFVGWSTASILSNNTLSPIVKNTYAPADVPSVTGPATYMASYAAKADGQHLITFQVDNSKISQAFNDGATVTPYAIVGFASSFAPGVTGTPTKVETEPGKTYTFLYWQCAENGKTYRIDDDLPKATADATYVARFLEADTKYDVTWNYMDPTTGSWTKVDAKKSVTYNQNPSGMALAADAQDFFKDGMRYQFGGWSTRKNADKAMTTLPSIADQAANGGGSTSGMMGSASLSFYAYYDKSNPKYTVTFVSNDGASEYANATDVAYGAKVDSTFAETGAAEPEYTGSESGWYFQGWSSKKNATAAESLPVVKGDSTYYAVFGEAPRRTITYWSDDRKKVLDTQTVHSGDTLADTVDVDTPTKAGKYFAGWKTADGGEPDFGAVITANTNLYASFADIESAGDGDTGATADVSGATLSVQGIEDASDVAFKFQMIGGAAPGIMNKMASDGTALVSAYSALMTYEDAAGQREYVTNGFGTVNVTVPVGAVYNGKTVKAYVLKSDGQAVGSATLAVEDGEVTFPLNSLAAVTNTGNVAIGYAAATTPVASDGKDDGSNTGGKPADGADSGESGKTDTSDGKSSASAGSTNAGASSSTGGSTGTVSSLRSSSGTGSSLRSISSVASSGASATVASAAANVTDQDLNSVADGLGVVIQPVTDELVANEDLGISSGAYIASVTPGGAADAAGLMMNDVVTAVDGVPVATPEEFVVAMSGKKAGDTVQLTVNRGGGSYAFDVTLPYDMPEIEGADAAGAALSAIASSNGGNGPKSGSDALEADGGDSAGTGNLFLDWWWAWLLGALIAAAAVATGTILSRRKKAGTEEDGEFELDDMGAQPTVSF